MLIQMRTRETFIALWITNCHLFIRWPHSLCYHASSTRAILHIWNNRDQLPWTFAFSKLGKGPASDKGEENPQARRAKWVWWVVLCILYTLIFQHANTFIIVAKCPGMAGTVLEFWPISQLCPGWHKIVLMSWNFYEFYKSWAWSCNDSTCSPKENIVDVVEPALDTTMNTNYPNTNLHHRPHCFCHTHHKL